MANAFEKKREGRGGVGVGRHLPNHPTVAMDGRCSPPLSSGQGGSEAFSACALEVERSGLEWRGLAKGEAGAFGPSFIAERRCMVGRV
jgi:hypothetical protein